MEVAILIGLRASGKTTFYRQRLHGTHEQVSELASEPLNAVNAALSPSVSEATGLAITELAR